MKYIKYSKQLVITLISLVFVFSSCNEDPYIVGYDGFTCTAEDADLVFESGSTGTVEAKVVAEKGLKTIKVKIGAWTSSGTASEDEIIVKGSPKIYDLSYSFQVPDNASVDNDITFVFEDYSGATIEYMASVTTVIDEVAPEVVIEKPAENDNKFSPLERVPFVITVTDDKKIKEAILSCEAISYTKTFKPADVKDKSISINEYVDIPVEGTYTFRLKVYDAQDNLTEKNIEVIISVGSKPAIVDQMTTGLIGVAGGKLPFNFKISTDSEHTITKVEIKITAADAATSKEFNPGIQIAEIDDALDIPGSADAHVNDLIVTVVATNNIGETSEWTGNCTIIKTVYVYGKATMTKELMEYSMPMQQIAGTNQFTYKTYAEVSGDGLKFWSGSFSVDPTTKEIKAVPVYTWGKKDNSTVEIGSATYIATSSTGYYVVTFDPVALTYTLEKDTQVPSSPEEAGIYAQVNNLMYKSGANWVAGSWNFIQFNAFPDNVHRFYIDVKTNGTGWDQAFFGLAAQPSDNGTMYSVPGGGWTYTFNGFTCPLSKVYSWDAAGKISEKGTTDMGTKFRMVVDTYLLQMGWLPTVNYTYPAITP